MLGLGADREICRRGESCGLRLTGAHAARPRYHGRLRPTQERIHQAARQRAHGAIALSGTGAYARLMTRNAQQFEYWNGPAGERWSKAQDRIDHHLGLITEALLGLASPREGERILDIGCGGGTTALLLRERVGPDGAVTGIDISAPNLALARARAHAGMADVMFLDADAATYEFVPVFDLALSRFGVMFFDDPAAAFANLRKALVKDGRLVFVCWRTFKENEWAFAPYQAALGLLPPQEPMDPHAPGPFAFADRERLLSVLEQAGLQDIRIKPLDTT